MIIKGSARGQSAADAAALARHLLAKENELAEVLEIRGVTAEALAAVLEEMRLVTMGSRARRGLYHASINLDRDEAPKLGRARWLEAADELERRLGMVSHQRCVVRHVKRGREHIHIVWCRVHPVTLRLARDSHNRRKHEECSRALEERWRLRPVIGAHTRHAGTPRPVAIATHGDWQAAERTGIPVKGVAAALQEAWVATTSGRAFAAAIAREGLTLARGRRGIIVVDEAGTPHSLPRRLQLRAAEVQRRLADIDEAALPTIDGIKAAIRRRTRGNTMNTTDMAFGMGDAWPRRGRRPSDRTPLTPDYWRQLGFAVDESADVLLIHLPGGTMLHDHGHRITLARKGEPTDEEIRLLVAAGKARGWKTVRFFNGSPEFQRRARVEALRQGYRIDQISLECEDGAPPPLSAAPMPEHIKRRIMPPVEPTSPPPQPSESLTPERSARS